MMNITNNKSSSNDTSKININYIPIPVTNNTLSDIDIVTYKGKDCTSVVKYKPPNDRIKFNPRITEKDMTIKRFELYNEDDELYKEWKNRINKNVISLYPSSAISLYPSSAISLHVPTPTITYEYIGDIGRNYYRRNDMPYAISHELIDLESKECLYLIQDEIHITGMVRYYYYQLLDFFIQCHKLGKTPYDELVEYYHRYLCISCGYLMSWRWYYMIQTLKEGVKFNRYYEDYDLFGNEIVDLLDDQLAI